MAVPHDADAPVAGQPPTVATDVELAAHAADTDLHGGGAEVTAHEAALDPHTGYLQESAHTQAQHTGLGLATSAEVDADVAAHAIAVDPHSGYATDADVAGKLDNTGGGKDVIQTIAAMGASQTLDLASANVFDGTLTAANCTITLSGATAGVMCLMTVMLHQDATGSRLATWPASVVWSGGTAPTLETDADAIDVVTLLTLDGGVVWYGFPAGGVLVPDLITALGDMLVGSAPGELAAVPVGTDGQVWTADSADPMGVKWATPSATALATFVGAKAYHSTTQSIANNTDVALALDSEEFDSDSFHDTATNNSRQTVPAGKDGVYLLVAFASFAASAAHGNELQLRKNGTTPIRGESYHYQGTNSVPERLLATAMVCLVAGDYVEMVARQNSGGAINVGSATTEEQNHLSIALLGV